MISRPLQQYISEINPESVGNINSYVNPLKEWPRNWSCVAGDMGGTHFRVARVDFDSEGNASVSGFKDFPMPGTQGEVSCDYLFSFYEEQKKSFGLSESALCFSYPSEIFPDGSAKILRLTKGIQLSGAVGYIINESVINDTVPALIGTRGANMGMVLGTGFNIAYVKDGKVIDAESGIFEGFRSEDFDYGPIAEMQVSGAYLNPLIEKMKGVISKEELVDRAAKVVASEIYGFAKYADYKAINLAVEGTTYYKLEGLRDNIEKYCMELMDNITFLDGRDTTLIGAAVALYERRYKK